MKNDVKKHKVSNLGKTWIFDLDGTIVRHNGYKTDGYDTLLEGAKEFLDGIPMQDVIIIVTSRKEDSRQITMDFLKRMQIRYDHILFGMPYGERILVNDKKISGLKTAIAVNTDRDIFMNDMFEIDDSI